MKKYVLLFGLIFIITTSIQSNTVYEKLNPLETIRLFVTQTTTQIKRAKKDGDLSFTEMKDIISFTALQRFDLRSIIQSLMGSYYNEATDEQKDGFMDAFSNRLLTIYSNTLKDLDNQKILFRRDYQSLPNGRALVRTILQLADGTRLPVEYYLRETITVGWLIYDIHIEGISVIAAYRNSFKDQFNSKSIDVVIKELNMSNNYFDRINNSAQQK